MELLAPPEALYARVYVDQAVSPLFIFSLKRKEKDERERGHRKRTHTHITFQSKGDTNYPLSIRDENLTARPLSRFMRTTTIKKTKIRKKM